MSANGKIFYAEASKGFIIKAVVDILVGTLQRGSFTLDENGISLRQINQKNTILFDISLRRENFRKYKCKNPMTISINLKHLQKRLKNVKKKDSLTFYIEEDGEVKSQLGITLRPEGGSKKTARFETSHVVYQEEKNNEQPELPDGEYGFPMVIESSDFQKIKSLISVGKVINIKIQKDNFISLKSDAGGVYDSEIGFGEIEDDSEEEKKSKKKTAPKGMYEAQFYSDMFNQLVKLPSLCTQIQFYAPHIAQFPLKLQMNASQGGCTLGIVQVFVKDVQQINFEVSAQEEPVKEKKVREKKTEAKVRRKKTK